MDYINGRLSLFQAGFLFTCTSGTSSALLSELTAKSNTLPTSMQLKMTVLRRARATTDAHRATASK